MNILKSAAASMLLVSLLVSCNEEKKGEARLSDDAIVAEFNNPSNTWRGKPFWSWNGKLEKDELIRQIGVFKDMGFGGYFMHSRVGLDTEYLGEEWFDLTNAVSDAGMKEGMENYLYDEDRWPSGTAGGYVTMKPEFRMHFLVMDTFEKSPQMQLPDSLVSAFTCNLDGNNFTDLQRINSAEEAMKTPGKTVLAFYSKEANKSNVYNGFTNVDVMKREATDYYIELTHEAYLKHCGNRIGTDILGIFTDEPNRGGLFSTFGGAQNRAPWTEKLPEEYAKRYGGDLGDKLPYLFLHADGELYNKVKWEFCNLTQDLFLENFVKPQHDWCVKHNMAYTGHYLHEDNLTSQVVNQGSLMRAYEYQDIPGIDNLTQYARTYWAAKQLASVARQTGKKMMLSELYGCSGWQMSFEDYKEAGDWQALFGINLRCPHLSWYTMKGEAKRDYPASISFQSGWYKDFKYVEDYYARLGLMLAQGKADCDLLVINPIESVYAQVSVDSFNALSPASPSMNVIERNYTDLFGWIEGNHYDFDYGDEEMMGRLASVVKGKNGTVLKFGEASYSTVFVGNMETMRGSTLALLKEFAAKGGKIILGGNAPSMIDVEPSEEAISFLSKNATCVEYNEKEICEALAKNVKPMAKITDASGSTVKDIFCQVRNDGDRSTFVLMSMSRGNDIKGVNITLPKSGMLSEWNCRNGEVTSLEADAAESGITISRDFAPLQEYVFVVSKNAIGEVQAAEKTGEAAKEDDKVSGTGASSDAATTLEYSLNEPNVLPLDYASVKAEGLTQSTPVEILRADRQIRDHFGLQYRGGEMLQPWFFRKYVGDKKPSFGTVELTYPFNVDVIPAEGLTLCLESPEDFVVTVNGTEVKVSDASDWWTDPCYKKIKIGTELIKKGLNSVCLKTDFTEDKNLEAMYLIGNFGVNLDGHKTTITTLPEKLALGDIVSQKLPFYSGTVSYNFGTVNAKAAKVDNFSGALVKLRKGEASSVIAYTPYCAEIPSGDGNLWVDVVLTRRNTFGPLHQLPAKTGAYGPEHFHTSGASWTDDYVLLPAGLIQAPELK